MNELNVLVERYPELSDCIQDIEQTIDVIVDSYANGGKLLLCGNGGSFADCEHIVGELMKGFLKKRPISAEQREDMKSKCALLDEHTLDKLQCGLPAISLPSLSSLNSAFANDVDPTLVYAQSVFALGKENDVLVAISTSGNAQNVSLAAKVAKSIGMKVVAMTGLGGGNLAKLSDVCIKAPQSETYKVQELHLPIYHCICAAVEKHFFSI